VTTHARLHDGVSAPGITSQYAFRITLAQYVDHLGMSCARREHEGRLVTVVQRGAWLLVAAVNENLDDVAAAEGGGEVEVGVAKAWGGCIGVVEQRRVRVQDARDEGRVAGVDCTTEADGRLDPGYMLANGKRRCERDTHMVGGEA
jgi:hypothetical protein